MRHSPRNGQYELFTHNNKTYCFDDNGMGPDPAIVDAPDEMWAWLRQVDGVSAHDETNVAYYLTPETYLLWKLTWL
jgi:hypothetical protein